MSNNSLRDRFVKADNPRPSPARSIAIAGEGAGGVIINTEHPIEINMKSLDGKLAAHNRSDVETVPRDTVLKMLMDAKLDEMFIFHTAPGEGENYLQAMRQVLSRARAKAYKKKTRLDEFKLLCHAITQKEEFDEVIVIRTKNMSEHEESVYDGLIEAFKKAD